MKKKTDRVFSAIRYIAKTVFLIYTLWCMTKAIDTAIIYKNMLPVEHWNSNISAGFPFVLTMFVFSFCGAFAMLFYKNEQINFNSFYKTFLHFLLSFIIVAAIITCAVQWPMTLTVLGFVILTLAIVDVRNWTIRRKAQTVKEAAKE